MWKCLEESSEPGGPERARGWGPGTGHGVWEEAAVWVPHSPEGVKWRSGKGPVTFDTVSWSPEMCVCAGGVRCALGWGTLMATQVSM